MFQSATLAELPSFYCGHAQDATAATGCTVVVAPQGATCGVDIRGGGPATRETDLLRPENMVEQVHAVVLSGGSAFGLEASCGVMDELASRGIGFPVAEARVPIVVGACLFDLLVGENTYPHAAMGKDACQAAFTNKGTKALAEGNVGAGCGASVGKLLGGTQAMKSGFGMCGLRQGPLVVVALVAVNALGNVRRADGTWIAGCRDKDNRVMDPLDALSAIQAMQAAQAADASPAQAAAAPQESRAAKASQEASAGPCANTTLGVILTNARLTKAQATKVSSVAHDAYARAIKPVHTQNDGDTIFTFASGEVDSSTDEVSLVGTEAMQTAIERAVTQAKGAYGLPAMQDISVR